MSLNRRMMLGGLLASGLTTSLPALAKTSRGRVLLAYRKEERLASVLNATLPLLRRESGLDFGDAAQLLPLWPDHASDKTADLRPDGKTLIVAPAFTQTLYPSLFSRSGREPDFNLIPVAPLTEFSFCFCVQDARAPAHVRDLASFIDWTRQHEEPPAIGHYGRSTPAGFLSFCMQESLGFEVKTLAYAGCEPMFKALNGGEIAAGMMNITTAVDRVRQGQLRPLFVTSRRRWNALPHVPTLVEASSANLWSNDNIGIFAPRGTSEGLIARLQVALNKVLEDRSVRAVIERHNFQPASLSTAEYERRLEEERTKWVRLIEAHPRSASA